MSSIKLDFTDGILCEVNAHRFAVKAMRMSNGNYCIVGKDDLPKTEFTVYLSRPEFLTFARTVQEAIDGATAEVRSE